MQDNQKQEEKKPEVVKHRPLGTIKVTIEFCIPRKDHPQLASIGDCQPMMFNIFANTKAPKELPDGLLADTRKVYAEVVDMIRTFVDQPLAPEVLAKLEEAEKQRIAREAIAQVEKPKGAPTVQVFERGLDGGLKEVTKPMLVDPQGNMLNAKES